MKTKYERLSKIEKKELYLKYKNEKPDIAMKMRNMFIVCCIGIIYSLAMFVYDFFYKHNKISFILDSIILLFCIIILFKTFNTKKELLNKYLLKLDEENKKKVLKKYKK